MTEHTTFADPNRVVYRGSQGIEILPGLENHPGSQGIEILQGLENHGL